MNIAAMRTRSRRGDVIESHPAGILTVIVICFSSEAGSDSDAYDFSLSRHIKSGSSDSSTLWSVSEQLQKESTSLEHKPSTGLKSSNVYRAIRSQYTGEGTVGGLQAAQVTAPKDTINGHQKSLTGLFRWVLVIIASVIYETTDQNQPL